VWIVFVSKGESYGHLSCLICKRFVQIAEEVEIQLQNYKKAVEEINKKTADAPHDQEDSGSHLDTQNLMAAVSSLPELTEKKKLLDKHASIATTLLGVIKQR